MTQIGIVVSMKVHVSFTPHVNQYPPCNFVPLFAVLINVMALNYEVIRTCKGMIAMATTYVTMFAITVYELSILWNKHVYVQTANSKVMSISDAILKHFKLCLRTSRTTLVQCLLIIDFYHVYFRSLPTPQM